MAQYSVSTASGIYERINGSNGVTRLVNGDILSIASGSYVMNAGELNPQFGVTIVGGNVTLRASGSSVPLSIKGSGTSNWYDYPITISGIAIDCSTSLLSGNGGIYIEFCEANLKNCQVYGRTTNTANGVFCVVAASKPTRVSMYQCQVYNISADCVSIRANSVWLTEGQASWIKLYNCLLHSPGQKTTGATQGASDQCFTTHEGIPVFAYGCQINNGITYSGTGPGHLYFCDIDQLKSYPNSSGINTSMSAVGHNVVFGSNLRSTWQMSFNTNASSGSTDEVFRYPQSKLRDAGLFKNNYVNWDQVNNAYHLLNAANNSNLIVDGNTFKSSTGTYTNKNLIRLLNGGSVTQSTGIYYVVRNNYFNVGSTCDILRSTVSVPVGTGLDIDISNNTFVQARAILSGGDSSDWVMNSASTTINTRFTNNFIASGNISRSNTLSSDVWGKVWMSGNVVKVATTTGFPGSKHFGTQNLFGTTGNSTNLEYTYQPNPGGNLDYQSGVPYTALTFDGSNNLAQGEQWIGARSRVTYDQVEFPTLVIS